MLPFLKRSAAGIQPTKDSLLFVIGSDETQDGIESSTEGVTDLGFDTRRATAVGKRRLFWKHAVNLPGDPLGPLDGSGEAGSGGASRAQVTGPADPDRASLGI